MGAEVRPSIRQSDPPQAALVAGDKWHLDEVAITIAGKKHWLWRAVDQEGVVLDILVQSRRNNKAAKRLLRKLLKKQAAFAARLDHRQAAQLRRGKAGDYPVSSIASIKG